MKNENLFNLHRGVCTNTARIPGDASHWTQWNLIAKATQVWDTWFGIFEHQMMNENVLYVKKVFPKLVPSHSIDVYTFISCCCIKIQRNSMICKHTYGTGTYFTI